MSEREERGRDRRRRRPEARRPVFDTSVPSPCISVCQIDEATDLCLGCARTLDEIRDWPIMSADEKRAALARIAARRGARERP